MLPSGSNFIQTRMRTARAFTVHVQLVFEYRHVMRVAVGKISEEIESHFIIFLKQAYRRV